MNKKKKIAIVVYSFSGGGLERVVSNSTYAFEKMGYEVHLYVLSSHIGYPFVGTLHQFPVNKFNTLQKIKAYIQFMKSIKDEKFDFIIDHRCRLNTIMEILWGKVFYYKEKVFYYIHFSIWSHFLFKNEWVNRWVYKGIFISVSKVLTQELKKQFKKLNIQTIHNFFYLDKEYPTLQNNYIATISRMDTENTKQVDWLLECYARSILPQRGIKLIIIGEGEKFNAMKELSCRLGLNDKVIFKGFVSSPYHYLANAQYTVLTSRYEGLPTVLIESLALGTPVISFNCPTGASEIVRHKENGLLVEAQNKEKMILAMNELIENQSLYQFVKNNSQKSVEKFSINTFIARWKTLLK